MSEIDKLVDQLKNRKIDRRQFLIKGAALGVSFSALGGILAACGGATATPAATETGTAAATATTAAATETATATAAATETATAAASATTAASTGGTVTIKYWKSAHSDHEKEYWDKIISDFEAANPNIKIDHTITTWETWDETYTAAFAGGDPPDVSYMPDQYYIKFADANQLMDLKKWVDDPSWASEKQAFFENPWKGGQYKSVQVGVPAFSDSFFIYANLDLMQKAGLSGAPATRDEMVQWAKKMTDAAAGTWGYGAATSAADSADFWYMQYFHDDGANFLNADLTANGFNNDAGIGSATFLQSLWCTEKVAPQAGSYNRSGLLDLFKGGKVGMLMEEASQHGDFKTANLPFKYDIFLQPGGKVKQTSFGNFGFNCMAAASKNPEEAWKWIAYIDSAPVVSDIAQKYGFAICRGDVKMYVSGGPYDDPIYRKIQEEVSPKIQGFQMVPQIREVVQDLNSQMEGVFGCTATPADALKTAGDQVDQLLKG
ncbi:MAG: sugar ABC transporter substrate-binding protein [Chloroflexi bacterium]|nr:sugar ABC transporter substrate-binding protein [Chloroflexota bacterium]